MAEVKTVGDNDLEFDIIGQGSFAHVIKAHHKYTQQEVEVKRITIDKFDSKQKKRLELEVATLRGLSDHENIIKMYHSQESGGFFCIVMDLCNQGTLDKYLRSHDVEAPQSFMCTSVCTSSRVSSCRSSCAVPVDPRNSS